MSATGAQPPREPAPDGSRVEVAIRAGSKEGSEYVVTLRNGGRPDGPTLVFTPAEWDAFVAGVRDGEFDLDEDGALVDLAGQGDHVDGAVRPAP
jgi:Domain of unknown function (DUF397)